MIKIIALSWGLFLATFFTACAGVTSEESMGHSHPHAHNTAPQPHNIDENNVGITSGETTDQIDPYLIEGNLEDNDFKN